MEKVIVDNYEVFADRDAEEVRFLINDDYLIIVDDAEAKSFVDTVVLTGDTLAIPAQRMAPQRIIPEPAADDDDVTLWELNYNLDTGNLSEFYEGDVEMVEFVLPAPEDAAELLDELSRTTRGMKFPLPSTS